MGTRCRAGAWRIVGLLGLISLGAPGFALADPVGPDPVNPGAVCTSAVQDGVEVDQCVAGREPVVVGGPAGFDFDLGFGAGLG